jgi:flagellar biosynthesis protein FlhF
MELKTYQGKSMAEALEKVKNELGRGAVILHTRTVRRGGLMGVGARSVVEITASREPALLPRADRPATIAALEGQLIGTGIPRERAPQPPRALQAEGAAMPRSAAATYGASLAKPSGDRTATLEQISVSTSALRGEMEELRTMVRQLITHQRSDPAGSVVRTGESGRPAVPIPEELHDYYTKLIQNAVADELARDVVARAKERLNEWRARLQAVGSVKTEPLDVQRLIPNALTDVIERMLPPSDPVQVVPGRGTKFVALIGPTGVGKTTTIAKLAAQFKLRDRKKVALITTDTYRIAAVAQLKAYAEIMGVPLDVVYTPEDLADIMQKMHGFDVVLIDTSGRSQNDADHLGDLQAFLNKARQAAEALSTAAANAIPVVPPEAPGTPTATTTPNDGGENAKPAAVAAPTYKPFETHLVLSCTSHSAQLQEVVDRFTKVGIDRVVFTKLDEAVGVGVILNIAHRLDVQLSYLTTGQDVPDDIEVGSRRRIAEMVLRPRKEE